ncbi:hypothetical protein BDB01DRAFT_811138 [Pilobolus umbonatus]|nr:hypothetical protein BDB01DRAFT_811138 [Pilobolus umbonatus]
MDNDREGIDWYREAKIRMNKNCECTYSLSAMDLLDICITPTIDHLTSLIYASLSTVFDKYKTTYMVIMGSPMELKCMDVRHQSMQRLQKAVQHRQKYFNHLTIHWITDDIPSAVFKGMRFIINNPLGGLLEQISSGMYYIIFNKIVYFLDKDWVRE